MGHRLSKISTKTGDDGTTGLGNGCRVSKSHIRIQVIGEIDELNSIIGLLRSNVIPQNIDKYLAEIQHRLFDLGGELSIPSYNLITQQHINTLELWIDSINSELPMLKEFILPGGSKSTAECHLARTVCRRAERSLVHLQESAKVDAALALRYLNRLSDLLFVLARYLLKTENKSEILWQR